MDNQPVAVQSDQIAAALREHARASRGAYAKATERAVGWDVAKFSRWCDQVGMSPMPAFPETVAAFGFSGDGPRAGVLTAVRPRVRDVSPGGQADEPV
jgi:hypothetical protein